MVDYLLVDELGRRSEEKAEAGGLGDKTRPNNGWERDAPTSSALRNIEVVDLDKTMHGGAEELRAARWRSLTLPATS